MGLKAIVSTTVLAVMAVSYSAESLAKKPNNPHLVNISIQDGPVMQSKIWHYESVDGKVRCYILMPQWVTYDQKRAAYSRDEPQVSYQMNSIGSMSCASIE